MDSSLDIKLQGFCKVAQEKLQNIFYTIPGKKDLIIEPLLIRPLEHVCGAAWLRSKSVEKIYKFDQKNPPQKNHQLIYFISSNLWTFKNVLDQIHAYNNAEPLKEVEMKNYHVILYPSVLKSFECLLEEEGLQGVIGLHHFQWDFIALDNGVLSLEIPQIYREVFIKHDYSLLGSLAHSVRLLNVIANKPKIILAYGENSERVLNMVHRIETFKRPTNFRPQENSDFSAMIIVDRSKDYPSCLLTPVVYAGLLSELFPLKTGTIQAEPMQNRLKTGRLDFLEITNNVTDKSDVGSIKMNSNLDNIYNDHKYTHFAEVITNLSAHAKSLGMEKDQTRNMKINEMKDFVANKLHKVATQKRELFKHLILCETIMTEMGANFEKLQDLEEGMITNGSRKTILSQIDEILSTSPHKYNILRLVCLFHITMELTTDECVNFIRNYCNAFGHQYLSVFSSFTAAKLLPDTVSFIKTSLIGNIGLPTSISMPKFQNAFQLEANKLKLLPSSKEPLPQRNSPECASYVFNGIYIPLIAQLSHILLKGQSIDEINAKLGHIEELKIGGRFYDPHALRSFKDIYLGTKKSEYSDIFPLRPRTIFVFVVGGVTYAEVAACSLIEKLTSSKIVIGSNCMISGSDLMSSFVD